MNRFSKQSAVDRLIALASDHEKSAQPPAAEPEPHAAAAVAEEAGSGKELEQVPRLPDFSMQELEQSPMWKALLQFRVLIPYLSRILGEMHDRVEPPTGATTEIRHSLGELQRAHAELRLAAQDQIAQMRRLEEELKRSREASERYALDSSELVEDVKSVRFTMRLTAGLMGGLGIVMIALLIYLIVRVPHLH
jgi:hypothetical protein